MKYVAEVNKKSATKIKKYFKKVLDNVKQLVIE